MTDKEKIIAVLGSTGSVGQQALDVALKRGYRVDFLTANRNTHLAEKYVRLFKPSYVAMADEESFGDLKVRISDTDTRVLLGSEGITEGIERTAADTVVNSIIGEAGLIPTLKALEMKKRLALANKESLVVAGHIVMAKAKEFGAEIIPVDSEHSAIFQSLKSGKESEIKKIILTASGGPFFGKTREELEKVTLADTLAHPTWKMGKKITVDSATLMNKGFEIIEAAYLFGVGAEKIEVVVHRESILHSAVEYIDNSVIGEFSVPDMRMCVQYAVDYPHRCDAVCGELDLIKLSKMTFFRPDTKAFPLIELAKEAMKMGGAMPAVLNAADEVAAEKFLSEKIKFIQIADVVQNVFETLSDGCKYSSLEDILSFDKSAREIAKNYILKLK